MDFAVFEKVAIKIGKFDQFSNEKVIETCFYLKEEKKCYKKNCSSRGLGKEHEIKSRLKIL